MPMVHMDENGDMVEYTGSELLEKTKHQPMSIGAGGELKHLEDFGVGLPSEESYEMFRKMHEDIARQERESERERTAAEGGPKPEEGAKAPEAAPERPAPSLPEEGPEERRGDPDSVDDSPDPSMLRDGRGLDFLDPGPAPRPVQPPANGPGPECFRGPAPEEPSRASPVSPAGVPDGAGKAPGVPGVIPDAPAAPERPPAPSVPPAPPARPGPSSWPEKCRYEVKPDSYFVIRFSIRYNEEGGRYSVVPDKSAGDAGSESHWVKFRMWNYREELDWKSAALVTKGTQTPYLDMEKLDRIKIRNLLLDWSFAGVDERMRLLHVGGRLSDESMAVFEGLFPSIADTIVARMNLVLESHA